MGSTTPRNADPHPTATVAHAAMPVEEEDTAAGTSVGRYMVLSEVGRGGMGRVLRAYDPKLQREVALKEVHRRLLGEHGTQRLVAEARAMAKLSHPNVVAVYDVEESGRDRFVVMEYVAGTTLKSWLAEDQRSVAAILERFVAAGRGLAAAHAADLLHRDFKPSNVLVGSDGAVKVTDFGLAKSESAVSSDSLLPPGSDPRDDASGSSGRLTRTGAVMGTPRYMAPEQHRPDGVLSPAVDQYAFCVALWEAFTRSYPFQIPGGARSKLLLGKLEGPGPWPREYPVPRHIERALRRGLARLPRDRFASMGQLLDELTYDPRQRRRWWGTGLGGIALLGVSRFLWSSGEPTSGAPCDRAAEQFAEVWNPTIRERAERAFQTSGVLFSDSAWRHAEREVEAFSEQWIRQHTASCEATWVRREQSEGTLELQMRCLQTARVEFEAVAEVLERGDPQVVTNVHALMGELPDLERCQDAVRLQQLDAPPEDPQVAQLLTEARNELARARVLIHAAQLEDARRVLGELEMTAREMDHEPFEHELAFVTGQLEYAAQDFERARRSYTTAMQGAFAWQQWGVAHDICRHLAVTVGHHLADLDAGMAHLDVARALLQPGHATKKQRVDTEIVQALLLRDAGRYQDAERVLTNLSSEGRLIEGSLRHARVLNDLAAVELAWGKYARAERAFRRVLEIRKQQLGRDHPGVADALNNIALMASSQGEYDQAEQLHRQALELRQRVLGRTNLASAQSWSNLAAVMRMTGRGEDAVAYHRTALAIRIEALEDDHPLVASSRNGLAIALESLGRHEEALHEHRAALSILETRRGAEHPDVAYPLAGISSLLIQMGRPGEAIALLRRALRLRQKAGVAPEEIGEVQLLLARAMWDAGEDRAAAREHARAALESFGRAPPDAVQADLRAVREWLSAHPGA